MLYVTTKMTAASSRYIDKLPKKLGKCTSKAMVQAMLVAEKFSKEVFRESGPVHPKILTARTGHLRRSIRSGAKGDIGWIGTNVRYGKVHERTGAGKAKIKRPFLKPALTGDNLKEVKNKYKEITVEGMNE